MFQGDASDGVQRAARVMIECDWMTFPRHVEELSNIFDMLSMFCLIFSLSRKFGNI
jgi:hypothetical protein